MILSLDISTACVGIALFEKNQLLAVSHIEPKINNKNKNEDVDKRFYLYEKALQINDYITNFVPNIEDIEEIVIEEPLISSKNIFTATTLNFFHGIMFSKLKQTFVNASFTYISVDNARRIALPEIVEKNVLFRNVPKVIEGVKINEYRKWLVGFLISKRYPQIEWNLNNNKTFSDSNFDIFDSVIVGTTHLINKGYIPPIAYDLNEAICFITEYIKYLKFINPIKGSVIEKNAIKRTYLLEVFNINKFINIIVF